LFIAFEGMGECHLDGVWHPMRAGDVLYAPALVPHGVRNPHTGPGAGTFVTCGGPTPFDVNFYRAIGATETVR
jgi:mannose-6-phosphate isomerase-like protein (cupin superfamily)